MNVCVAVGLTPLFHSVECVVGLLFISGSSFVFLFCLMYLCVCVYVCVLFS